MEPEVMLRNITMSAEAVLIDRARAKARAEGTTLNEAFRLWLERYTGQEEKATSFLGLMDQLSYAQAGRSFTRDERNER